MASPLSMLINAIVDFMTKEVEFTVSGETDGWLAFAFNENAQVSLFL
jgi:hypothetical protein